MGPKIRISSELFTMKWTTARHHWEFSGTVFAPNKEQNAGHPYMTNFEKRKKKNRLNHHRQPKHQLLIESNMMFTNIHVSMCFQHDASSAIPQPICGGFGVCVIRPIRLCMHPPEWLDSATAVTKTSLKNLIWFYGWISSQHLSRHEPKKRNCM